MEVNYADVFNTRGDSLYPNDPSLVTEDLQLAPLLPRSDPSCKITVATDEHHTLWEHSVVPYPHATLCLVLHCYVICDTNLCIS